MPQRAMFSIDFSDKFENNIVVLVTGANTGLGLATCCRVIDEFLHSFPDTHRLTLIFTTRGGAEKSKDTHHHLRTHANRHGYKRSNQVRLLSEAVDLLNLASVRALSRRLNRNIPKLDAIILNAGIGGWTGLNWPSAIWNCLTDILHATTWPIYKCCPVGMLANRQTTLPEETPLGGVFCANVFGHYMLSHNLMSLLRRSGSPNGPGRIIWISSVEATINAFAVDDIQGFKSTHAYESSKALTDILALTSDLPSTAPYVNSFLSIDPNDQSSPPSDVTTKPADGPAPVSYVSHPGICGTSIVPLSLPLFWCMITAFYLSRWLGSPWHNIWSYTGACASAWLALSPQPVLDEAEAAYRSAGGGHAKWGSSTDRLGHTRPASTEIDGWGYGGVVGSPILKEDAQRRRKRGMKNLTSEDKVRFEELGRRCWREMEELRIYWEKLLDLEEDGKRTQRV